LHESVFYLTRIGPATGSRVDLSGQSGFNNSDLNGRGHAQIKDKQQS
jgi:hypothetical protein